MQSYEHHVVRETLEMRHPYLQDEAFTPEITINQVTVAVSDRMLSKLKQVLEAEDQEYTVIVETLMTLNDSVHHQETCDRMIEEGLVQLISTLLKSEDPEVREQSAKLLSQFALSAIARQEFDHAF